MQKYKGGGGLKDLNFEIATGYRNYFKSLNFHHISSDWFQNAPVLEKINVFVKS